MSEDLENKVAPVQGDENHIIAERRAKLAQLRAEGVAYPNNFKRTDLFGDLVEKYGNVDQAELEASRFRWLVLVV